jgi:hypothetical protein
LISKASKEFHKTELKQSQKTELEWFFNLVRLDEEEQWDVSRGHNTHSSRGVIATVESSMGGLPSSTTVNAWDSGVNQSEKRHQRNNAGHTQSSHSFQMLLETRRKRWLNAGLLGGSGVWENKAERTAIYRGSVVGNCQKKVENGEEIITLN